MNLRIVYHCLDITYRIYNVTEFAFVFVVGFCNSRSSLRRAPPLTTRHRTALCSLPEDELRN
jgi:hypothetical protein